MYQYGENGYRAREELDSELDGDTNILWTYVCDANGYMLTYVFTEGTGAVYRGTYTYTECL